MTEFFTSVEEQRQRLAQKKADNNVATDTLNTKVVVRY